MSKKSKHPVRKRKAAVPGQGKGQDVALKLMFRSNDNFAEVFNRTVTKDIPIPPELLREKDTDEVSLVTLRKGSCITLQQFRDVVKGLEEEATLVIFGIENQTHVHYAMPYRVLELELLNYGRQISMIQERHKVRRKSFGSMEEDLSIEKGASVENNISPEENNTPEKGTSAEYLGGFYKTDRLVPVVCLVIYYGEEEWDGPTSMAEMFVESPWAVYASPHPIYLLDVRHMSDDSINEYSDALRPFFGFLKYEHRAELEQFIADNEEQFSNLPENTVRALAEITRSEELVKIREEYLTDKGGVNMCLGIQLMVEKGKKEGIEEGEMIKANEMAKKMIQSGEPGGKIVLYTGLEREVVDQLARGMKITLSWELGRD